MHVFDVSMKAGAIKKQVEALDNCRVTWGRVKGKVADRAVVEYRPLVLDDGKLALGKPVLRTARLAFNGKGYLLQLPARRHRGNALGLGLRRADALPGGKTGN